jgi:hypothetical protein
MKWILIRMNTPNPNPNDEGERKEVEEDGLVESLPKLAVITATRGKNRWRARREDEAALSPRRRAVRK